MNANLLNDDVFGVVHAGGRRERLSLPGLLAAMGQGTVEGMTGIQRHQVDAFHIFLVYLAATVLDRKGHTDPTRSEAFWQDGLLQLAGSAADAAWTLVVEDPARPAFMQPPVTKAEEFSAYQPKAATPDELDVLQTASNHDLKCARMGTSSPEAWAYALVSLQTMGGYLGKGNYGIGRMNSGSGSRICVESVTSEQSSLRWQQDVERLLALKPDLLPPHRPYREDGHALLWLVPWDGMTGLGLDALHPFFIEICRLIRLIIGRSGTLTALGKPSEEARLTVSEETKGNLGDPWTPVKRKDDAVLTVPGAGFTPDLLCDLMIAQQNFRPAPFQALIPGEAPAWFHATVLVRGQGKTDGYHEARVRIEPKIKGLLLHGGGGRDRLSAMSEWALTRAREVHYKALRPALFALMEGGPSNWPDIHRREIGAWADLWLARYNVVWGQRYFPWLWTTIEDGEEESRDRWLRQIKAYAEEILETALRTAPQRTGWRYRGKVRSRGLFHGAFKKHFAQEMRDA
jgi:CRISPR system Cascade subunit CasA